MEHSIAEILMTYALVIAFFVGLPSIVFAVVFLPALMRTTGETIGFSERLKTTKAEIRARRATDQQALKQPLAMPLSR